MTRAIEHDTTNFPTDADVRRHAIAFAALPREAQEAEDARTLLIGTLLGYMDPPRKGWLRKTLGCPLREATDEQLQAAIDRLEQDYRGHLIVACLCVAEELDDGSSACSVPDGRPSRYRPSNFWNGTTQERSG